MLNDPSAMVLTVAESKSLPFRVCLSSPGHTSGVFGHIDAEVDA